MDYPKGFSRLESAAGEDLGFIHFCPKCRQSTTIPSPDSKLLAVWHCGATEELELTALTRMRMPTVRLERTRTYDAGELLRRGVIPVGAEVV